MKESKKVFNSTLQRVADNENDYTNDDDEDMVSFRRKSNGDDAGMQDHQIYSKTVTSFAYKGIHIHVYKHMTLDRLHTQLFRFPYSCLSFFLFCNSFA